MLKQIYKAQMQFFSRQAAQWHFPNADRLLLEELLIEMNLKPADTVLDVGCGNGQISAWLLAKRPLLKVIAIDACRAMLLAKPQHTAVAFIQAYAEQLPLKAQLCDLVLNYCVFPHLKFKAQAIKEYRRVLKPNGRVIIIHPGGRHKVNQKHQEIGYPVAQDLIPAPTKIMALFAGSNFSVGKIIDNDRLFWLEFRRD